MHVNVGTCEQEHEHDMRRPVPGRHLPAIVHSEKADIYTTRYIKIKIYEDAYMPAGDITSIRQLSFPNRENKSALFKTPCPVVVGLRGVTGAGDRAIGRRDLSNQPPT